MGEEVTEKAMPKPWVQVACVCEKALREPDNVASLIRVVDTYFVSPELSLPVGIKAGLPLTIVVFLKSGEAAGEFELAVRLTRPDGQQNQVGKWPVTLNGGEHGMNLVMTFGLESPVAFGLYWFDVLWAEEVLTRIPLRIKPTAAETSPESTGSEMSQQVAR